MKSIILRYPKTIITLALFLLFLIFTSFVFVKTNANLRNQAEKVIHIQALEMLNNEILAFVSSRVTYVNYDDIVNKQAGFRKELIRLREDSELRITDPAAAQIDTLLKKVDKAFQAQSVLIEDFKSYKSIVNNSVHYIFSIQPRIRNSLCVLDQDRENRESMTLIFRVLSAILVQNIEGIGDINKIEALINEILLDDLNPANRKMVQLFKRHARQIVSYQKKLDTINTLVNNKELTKSLNALKTVMVEYYRKKGKRLKEIGVSLFVITFVLFLVLIYFFIRADRNRKKIFELMNAVQNSDNSIVITDLEGTIQYVNKAFERNTQYAANEAIGQNSRILNAKSQPDEYYENMWETILNGDTWYDTFHNKRKDGTYFYEKASISPVFLPDGSFRSFIAIKLDITREKELQNKLEAANQALNEQIEELKLLQSAIEHTTDSIVITDKDGRIEYANPAYGKMTGCDCSEAPGTLFKLLKRGPHNMNFYDEMWKWLAKGDRYCGVHSCETADGTMYYDEETIIPIIDENGERTHFVAAGRNITERIKVEEERLNANKLESLGILAGGIAHDFNNILTAVLGNISIAKLAVSKGKQPLNYLEEAENACVRIKDLTLQLLTFSKGGSPVRKSVSMSKLVSESARFMLHGSSVDCHLDLQDNLWGAIVDEGQINQVMNNLVINAVQAMPDGGTLKIKAENRIMNENNPQNLKAGRYVKLSVEDQGVGIQPENLSKVFDPYFTTKQNGTGLGLASAYSIITKHQGCILLNSSPGKGTCFAIYLPASMESAAGTKENTAEEHHGTGNVLIMDDDPNIRNILGEMLEMLGYTVAFASDGQRAIDMYRDAMNLPSKFDVIIMDLTIPGGMGGQEAITTLRKIDPHIRAIVSSGYSNDDVMANYQDYGFTGVVAKPYDLRVLSKTLREILR